MQYSKTETIQNKIISTSKNDFVSKKSLDILGTESQWLNGEIINMIFSIMNLKSRYFSMIIDSKPDRFMSCYFFTQLTSQKIDKYKFEEVKRYFRKEYFCKLLNGYRRIFIPVNYNNIHWTLLCLDFELKRIIYYDMLGISSCMFYNKTFQKNHLLGHQ